jgi:hypothetical protein
MQVQFRDAGNPVANGTIRRLRKHTGTRGGEHGLRSQIHQNHP